MCFVRTVWLLAVLSRQQRLAFKQALRRSNVLYCGLLGGWVGCLITPVIEALFLLGNGEGCVMFNVPRVKVVKIYGCKNMETPSVRCMMQSAILMDSSFLIDFYQYENSCELPPRVSDLKPLLGSFEVLHVQPAVMRYNSDMIDVLSKKHPSLLRLFYCFFSFLSFSLPSNWGSPSA